MQARVNSTTALYEPLYDEVRRYNFTDRYISLIHPHPDGVIYDHVGDDDEVVFHPLGSGKAVPLQHDHMTITVPHMDMPADAVRQAALNAYQNRLNHIHFYPFLNARYGDHSRTLAPRNEGDSVEWLLNTLELAIGNMVRRRLRGPFALLVGTREAWLVDQLRERFFQQRLEGAIYGLIPHVIGYTGARVQWPGQRLYDYPGVPAGKAYLISLDSTHLPANHQSFEQTAPRIIDEQRGEESSEFLVGSTFALYCNPLASTEEIDLSAAEER